MKHGKSGSVQHFLAVRNHFYNFKVVADPRNWAKNIKI